MVRKFIDISDDSWGQDKQIIKRFTDRENPQEAFERKFRAFSENWKRTFAVLCYYGIGGIGKTSFKNELCKLIRGVSDRKLFLLDRLDCDYIEYDFADAPLDKLSILLRWRKQLMAINPKFKFFRFDSAVLLYSKKTGKDFEKDETAQTLLENNPWLSAALTAAELLPFVGWISNVIQAFDQSAKATVDAIHRQEDSNRYRAHLNEIDSLEPSELKKKLHEYFIYDMRNNMMHVATRPIVSFLDTYEKYIDTVNREISMIDDDYWLRKYRDSVIQSIPGILWVITGRERLYWSDDDPIWDELPAERPLDEMTEEEKEALAGELLEQHLLGDLSLKDATYFLQQADITDPALCEQLYKLTSGTPLFLDICVDTYHNLCAGGQTPTIENFGTDLTQLISRYLSNMHESTREMAYFLACLGSWTNNSVRQIAASLTALKSYSYTRYEEFVKHSFIIRNRDGSYYMHETVRTAAVKNADPDFANAVKQAKLSALKTALEQGNTLASNDGLQDFITILTETTYEYPEFYRLLQLAKEKFRILSEEGTYDLLYTLSRELYLSTKEKYPDTGAEYITASEYGDALRKKGLYKEAAEVISAIPLEEMPADIDELDWTTIKFYVAAIHFANGNSLLSKKLGEEVLETRKRLLPEDHPDLLKAMNGLAGSYQNLGYIKEALELREKVYHSRLELLGEEHPDTLKAMHTLASSYSGLSEYKKALELRERVLELRLRILGEDHPDTNASMNNLALSYKMLGRTKEAFALQERTLEISRRILGPEHPDTIASLSNLARTYADLGDYKSSLLLLNQSVELFKKTQGEEHPKTLATMYSLALRYEDSGDWKTGLSMKEQVLETRRRILGEEHPDTINSLGGVASSYEKLGNSTKAMSLKTQVYETRKRLLGEEHPDTLSALMSIAISYESMGHKQTALTIKEEIYQTQLRLYGPEHPDTLSSMHNLAVAYSQNDDDQKALELREALVEIRTRICGEEHLSTLSSLSALADSYLLTKQTEKGLALHQKIYETRLRLLGEEHPDTISSLGSLAYAHWRNQNYETALAMDKEHYESCKKIWGEDHKRTINALNSLAGAYYKTGDHEKAKDLYAEVLEARRRVLGETHISTLSSMSLLASFYESFDAETRAAEILSFREKVYFGYKQALGREHKDTNKALLTLYTLYEKLGERRKASRLAKEYKIIGEIIKNKKIQEDKYSGWNRNKASK